MNAALAQARTQALARWRALPTRERRLLALAGVVLGAYLLWVLALRPPLRTILAAPAELAALDLQAQTMGRLAAEVTELRATPPIDRMQAGAALQAATERLGEAGRLSLQGDRAVLTLNNVGTNALRDWLAEARSGARARPLETNLARAAQGYSGTLVVALGGGS